MKKIWLFLFLGICIFITAACYADRPVLPQAPESVTLIFVAPQSGDFAIEGVPATAVFNKVLEQSADDFPYALKPVIIDEMQNDEEIAAQISTLMENENVLGIFGFWDSDKAEPVIKLCKKNRIPLLLWAAMREDLTTEKNYPFVLRLCPIARTESTLLADAIIKGMGLTDWAVITDNSSYGLANQETILQSLEKLDCEARYTLCLDKQTANFDFIAEELLKSQANIVYFGGKPENLLSLLSVLKKADLNIKIAATGASSLPYDKLLEGVYTINYDFAQYSRFYEEYYLKQGFSLEMGIMTPLAYEGTKLLLEALASCGDAPDGILLAYTMAAIQFPGILNTISFDSIGESTDTSLLNVCRMQDMLWIK